MSAVILIQIFLAIALYFLFNWIGANSTSLGYISLSLYNNTESSIAYNFVIRVMTPVVYLFLVASVLYSFGLDRFTYNLYIINVFYVSLKLIETFIRGSYKLINWKRQILYWFCILGLSYYSYAKVIVFKKNLHPDFATLSNELWIIIIVFLYNLINDINPSRAGAVKRKELYITAQFKKFNRLYGSLIEKLEKDRLQSLAYAIIIYEDFNRSKVIRRIENISFLLTKKSHTLGVMQVNTSKLINDYESVQLGVNKIKADYIKFLSEYNPNEHSTGETSDQTMYNAEEKLLTSIIGAYNGGYQYNQEITELISYIEKNFFKYHNRKLIE